MVSISLISKHVDEALGDLCIQHPAGSRRAWSLCYIDRMGFTNLSAFSPPLKPGSKHSFAPSCKKRGWPYSSGRMARPVQAPFSLHLVWRGLLVNTNGWIRNDLWSGNFYFSLSDGIKARQHAVYIAALQLIPAIISLAHFRILLGTEWSEVSTNILFVVPGKPEGQPILYHR